MATAADEPVIMLTAPAPATRRCLARAKMALSDVDLIEINEAFAAIPLKTMRDLQIDHVRVNVNDRKWAGLVTATINGVAATELSRTTRRRSVSR